MMALPLPTPVWIKTNLGNPPRWEPGVLYEWKHEQGRWKGHVKHVDGRPLAYEWWVDQADLMPRDEGQLVLGGGA